MAAATLIASACFGSTPEARVCWSQGPEESQVCLPWMDAVKAKKTVETLNEGAAPLGAWLVSKVDAKPVRPQAPLKNVTPSDAVVASTSAPPKNQRAEGDRAASVAAELRAAAETRVRK